MLRFLLRIAVYLSVVVVLMGGVIASGYLSSQKAFWGSVRQEPVPSLQGVQKPQHDPNKPTVVVLLGNENTEGLDFMIPYQLFSMTGAYNVYAVAEDNQVRSLTGGLDVVPHYSFKEMDELLGKSADIIAIPYMTMRDPKSYEPVRKWILQHKETTLISICAGADNLAATGLLDGKSAATHWQTMPVLTKKYPEVNWINDQRFVSNGPNLISSAGISSGIDAVLYVISQQLGEPMAAKIANELKYPSYHFVQNPKVEPFYVDLRYATYVLNNAFQWSKNKAGVLLYDGVEEMALASVFDIYADTGTTRVLSVSSSEQPIVTKHGLNVIARHSMSNLPKLDKMIVPGIEARSLATEELKSWNEKGNTIELQFVHADSPDRFIFEVQLEDLAKQEDLLTAKHAVKRLEFRANDFQLVGKPFPLETYGELLLTLAVSVLVAFYLDRRFILKRKRLCCGRRSETLS
ncbi:DJ-1/PfpI family protein [Brevibacillus sp. LEMMJ03]|jgi:AraC family transcriptional regulator, transcriptional activator FtrA|uniref:DJ-1/PfpI family protein n=1 Tax=Brevibacillus sp. LEMMJ03 TaxID=2595056 RepID=UPI00117CC373|nr:DJ-1/PfpI family protein [Brevibacillus sp. LEMMJ03]TRY27015.1 DJ-1/PfpI family protein [Brevibacillus sp. LEMMJ03]